MVRLTKIYTKGGDKGKTSLGDGTRVSKSHPRLKAMGSVDELNAFIGLASLDAPCLKEVMGQIQNDLFDLGGDLCFPEDKKPEGSLQITKNYIERLEKWIDFYNEHLPELDSFVLPGGTRASAQMHLARTVARRAERDLCELIQEEKVNPFCFQYLNRLSDLLFVLARYENKKGALDVLWVPGGI